MVRTSEIENTAGPAALQGIALGLVAGGFVIAVFFARSLEVLARRRPWLRVDGRVLRG